MAGEALRLLIEYTRLANETEQLPDPSHQPESVYGQP
jgi:hypothetical protein